MRHKLSLTRRLTRRGLLTASCAAMAAPLAIGPACAQAPYPLRQEDIIARLRSLSVEVRENTPEEFRAFVAAETVKWGRVVREANIKLG